MRGARGLIHVYARSREAPFMELVDREAALTGSRGSSLQRPPPRPGLSPAGRSQGSPSALHPSLVDALLLGRAGPSGGVHTVLALRLAKRIATVQRWKRRTRPARHRGDLLGEKPSRGRRPGLQEPNPIVVVRAEEAHHVASHARRWYSTSSCDLPGGPPRHAQAPEPSARNVEGPGHHGFGTHCVEAVKKDVLSEVALREQTHRAIPHCAETRVVDLRSPRSHERVREVIDIDTA
jgi:hypothetical protein